MSTENTLAEIYNSTTFFGMVAAIAIGIMLLLIKQDLNSKNSKIKK